MILKERKILKKWEDIERKKIQKKIQKMRRLV